MTNIALIETKPSRNDYYALFDGAFDFDKFCLCSDPTKKKVLVRDVDIEGFHPDNYDWVILVGSEAFKHYTKLGTMTTYSGKKVGDKFLPIINPAMLAFKPEARPLWEDSKNSIKKYIAGEIIESDITESIARGINNEKEALDFIRAAIEYQDDYVALDSETTDLYPRNGYMMGASLSYELGKGAYITTDCFTEEVEAALQELFNKKIVIFHNAAFDLWWFQYHFGFKFPRYEDTMLMHYLLDETPGTHGLKNLALRHTPYGDYEKPLYDWVETFKKQNGLRKDDFCWEFIPYDIMKTYAAMDAVVTKLLFNKFSILFKNDRLTWVYRNILLEGTSFLVKVKDHGVPFSESRLKLGTKLMQDDIDVALKKLYTHKEIRRFEEIQGKPLNPNSVLQLRSLLFDFLGLTPPGKLTGTGKLSTDAEVLEGLATQSEVPRLILDIRKKSKIKNTYLDKIIPQLDKDSRLRTSFNLHTTTSGRLSSSGKLNMQQLPRDEPIVKGCIEAAFGRKIVSIDLVTAEMYIAAVLSKDEALIEVFKEGKNFHSTIAKRVFGLTCSVEEVPTLYPLLRQAAKAVSFGILYGAGANKISAQITKDSGKFFSPSEAQEVINEYFKEFHKLKDWIEENQKFIASNGFIYSFFGRKRRLPNVSSSDRGVKGHAIRSGLNFLVQSTASDVNFLAAIEMNNFIEETNMDAKIFALVHDSILADVAEEHVESYCSILGAFIQKDRGISIPDCPIGYEVDVGSDYSMGGFEEKYGHYVSETA